MPAGVAPPGNTGALLIQENMITAGTQQNLPTLCLFTCFFNTDLPTNRFMMLSLELHHSCRYDYVEVRDGDSINSRVIGRFCGNNRPAPIQSSGNSLHVLFVSDGYKNFDGFFAIFQESSGRSKDQIPLSSK